MIVVIDNYDSFVYNIVHSIDERVPVEVYRNDELTVEELDDLDPDGVIVSPGPGHPEDAGISTEIFDARSYPSLGICLGYQALCCANGARLERVPEILHGEQSTILLDSSTLGADLPDRFDGGRYHSLMVRPDSIPSHLDVTAETPSGIPMAVEHQERPHFGTQFHPESVLTEHGTTILRDFVSLAVGSTPERSDGDVSMRQPPIEHASR